MQESTTGRPPLTSLCVRNIATITNAFARGPGKLFWGPLKEDESTRVWNGVRARQGLKWRGSCLSLVTAQHAGKTSVSEAVDKSHSTTR